MARITERQRQTPDMWPGFVDALAALLVVIIFLVMVFTVAQFFLSDVLVGREKAVDDLRREVTAVSELLSLERTKASRAREEMEQRIADLGQDVAERDETIARLVAGSKELFALLSLETERYREAARDVETTERTLRQTRAELAEEQEVGAEALRQIEILNLLLAGIRSDLAERDETVSQLSARSEELTAALDAERQAVAAARKDIGTLTARLEALRGDLADRAETISRLHARSQELDALLAAERERSATAESELETRARRLAEMRGELEQARTEIGTLSARTEALRRDLATRDETVSRLGARSEELAAALDAARQALERTRTQLAAERKAGADARTEVRELAALVEALRQDLAKGTAALSRSQARSGELTALVEALRQDLAKDAEALSRSRSRSKELAALVEALRRDLARGAEALSRSRARSRELDALLAAERERSATAESELETRARMIATARGELAEARKTGADAQKEIEELTALEKALRRTAAENRQVISLLGIRSQELADLLATETERAEKAEDEARSSGRSLEQERARLAEEREVSAAARKRAETIAGQVAALRRELVRVNAALEASETEGEARLAEIAGLEKRLSGALVSKVTELARYRSEFFGKLREALGKRKGIRVVGDRFVLQSEILFDSGSTDFSRNALAQIDGLARTLKDVSARIPEGVDWVLRVDGHTDRVPIKTPAFPSNWELSTGRAIALVRELIDRGIPADRLFAAGFGSNHPIDPRDTPGAYSINRRIELKLTQR